MADTNYGMLTVRLYTAGGALPVPDASVIISGADEDNSTVIHSLITDVDGKTATLSLGAPSREGSLAPNSKGANFSNYNAEISKEGYYSKTIRNIPIFSGVSATLPINMIPKSQYNNGESLPGGEMSALITENENLE